MPKAVIFSGDEKTEISVEIGCRIHEILQRAEINFPLLCGGNHTCGKCKIRCEGNLSACTEEESRLLSESEKNAGIRMACFAEVCGDVEIYLPDEAIETLSVSDLPEHELTQTGWGVAVDIGTTTVAMQLYNMSEGRLYGETLGGNQQARYGADVISRIEFSNQHGMESEHNTIHEQLESMADECMCQAGIQNINDAVITGNTTMLHFWEGLDPRGIAVSPFTPQSLFGCQSKDPLAESNTFLPPCLGSYIGADITCDILASGLMKRPEKSSLLIDLGTNGEIVVCHNGVLYCASTAMGPAFEGAGLTYGMRASAGAINTVCMTEDDAVAYTTIGGTPAEGICGSGVLDAVRVMLELGVLDESGLIDDSASDVVIKDGRTAWQIPGTNVSIAQEDIRQIQLAKAAVCAGIETLLREAGIRPEKVDSLYIAGGFGNYMDFESAVTVGLFPETLRKAEYHVIGNAALAGAALLLLDSGKKDELKRIQECAKEIPLSGNSSFSNLYIENIIFNVD